MGEGVLAMDRGAYHHYIWRCYLIEKTHGLARVQNQQDVLIEVLDVHFIENFGEIFRMNDLCVLDLEKVLSAMTIHINEEFSALITLQSLRLRESRIVPTPYKI